MTSPPARVFLIDHHHALRQAVGLLLDQQADIRVVGQSADLQSGLLLMEALETFPSVVVVDARLHDPTILRAVADISRRHPESGVVVFTTCSSPSHVWSVVNAGARGYVLKSADSGDLLGAVRSVANGGAYLHDEIVSPLLKRVVTRASDEDDGATFSMRHLRILEALADGMSNKMVARTLAVTEETVKSHLKRIYEMLGAKDRAHAVAIAFRYQLIR